MNEITKEKSQKTLEMMATEEFRNDFTTQLKARQPLFYTTTNEENRFISFLEHFCRVNGYTCYLWDCYKGLTELDSKEIVAGTDDTIILPTAILQYIEQESLRLINDRECHTTLKRSGCRGVMFVLLDFFRFIDPKHRSPQHDIERRLKALSNISGVVSTIITGPRYAVPEVLENLVPTVDFPYPNKNEIKTVLWRAVASTEGKITDLRDKTIPLEEDLVNSVSGLTLTEAQSAFAKSLVLHKDWNIPTLLKEKKQIIAKSGILEFYDKTVDINEIGGLKNLKHWIMERKHCFSEEAKKYGLVSPKGVLTIGMPGCVTENTKIKIKKISKEEKHDIFEEYEIVLHRVCQLLIKIMKKLRDYANEHNVTYMTAYNHFKQGLIEGAYQLPTGTVVIPDSTNLSHKKEEYTITYARVSSSENKSNLESQSKRLTDFCNAKGWQTHENITEIGSGINDKRVKLNKIFKEKKVTRLVVEHKDRLTRFGFNYIKEICDSFGCEIIIINETISEKEDIVQDFVSIITSFCSKLYGQRRAKRKTEQIIQELNNE